VNVSKVLVIGGSGGIGAAVARQLVASGGQVFLAGRNSQTLAAAASELGVQWTPVEATEAAAVDACADAAAEALGGLTGITNCVGSILLKPAHLTQPEDWKKKKKTKKN